MLELILLFAIGYAVGRVVDRVPKGVHVNSKPLAQDPVFVEELADAIRRAAKRRQSVG